MLSLMTENISNSAIPETKTLVIFLHFPICLSLFSLEPQFTVISYFTPIIFIYFSSAIYSTLSETGVGPGIDLQNMHTPNWSYLERSANTWLKVNFVQLFLLVFLPETGKQCLTVSQSCRWSASPSALPLSESKQPIFLLP